MSLYEKALLLPSTQDNHHGKRNPQHILKLKVKQYAEAYLGPSQT